jgi:hypothetical protein
MKHLRRYKKYYYFRLRIPKDLAHLFPFGFLNRSLRTQDIKSAKLLVRIYESQTETLFVLLRSGILTEQQLQAALKQFDDDVLLKHRFEMKLLEDTPNKLKKPILSKIPLRNISQPKDWLYDAVDAFIGKYKLEVDNDSEYKRVRKAVLERLKYHEHIKHERSKGNFENDYDKPILHPNVLPSVQGNKDAEPEGGRKKLSELTDEHVEFKSTKESWNEKNKDEHIAYYKQLVELLEDKYVHEFTRKDFMEYINIVKKLPANVNKLKRFRDIPIKQLVAMIKKGELTEYKALVNRH